MSVALYHYLGDFIISAFKSSPEGNVVSDCELLLRGAIRSFFSRASPLWQFVTMIGVFINFLMVGPVFAYRGV